jgi:hypothetical protein
MFRNLMMWLSPRHRRGRGDRRAGRWTSTRVSRAAGFGRTCRLNGVWQALNRSELRHRSAQRAARWRFARGTMQPCPRHRSRTWRSRIGSARRRRRRRRRASLSPRGAHTETPEPGELADVGSRNQVLPARRAARDLHAVPVTDPSKPARDRDRLRVRGRGARPVFERPRPRAGRFVDGTVRGALGQGHAGGGRHQPQRCDMVRSRRQFPQRRAARDRTVYAHGPGPDRVRRHDR